MRMVTKKWQLPGFFFSLFFAIIFFISSYGRVYAGDQWIDFQPFIRENLNRFIVQRAPSASGLQQVQGILNSAQLTTSGNRIDISRLLAVAEERYSKGDRSSSTTLFNYALSQAGSGGDNKQLLGTLTEIGTFFQAKGEKAAAIEYLSRAVDASLLSNDETKLDGLLKTLEPLYAWQELQEGAPKNSPGSSGKSTSTPSSGSVSLPSSIPGVQIPNVQIPNISLPNVQIPGLQLPRSMPNVQIPNIQIPNLSIPNGTIPGGGDVLSTLGNILNGGKNGGDVLSTLGNIMNSGKSSPSKPDNIAAVSIPKSTSYEKAPPVSIPRVEQPDKVSVIAIPKYTPEPETPAAKVETPSPSTKTKAIRIPKYNGGPIATSGAIPIPRYENSGDKLPAAVSIPSTSRNIPAASSAKVSKPSKASQPEQPRQHSGLSTLTIRNITSSEVLPCVGPRADLRAYEDLDVRSEWAARYLNPVPGGRYAPYAGDTGLDIIAPRARPLYAAKDGIVLYSAPSGHCIQRGPSDDQGAMRIRHPDGTDTFYAHLSGRNASLKAGSKVKQGDWMGDIGQANNVAHLHFTIYYSPSSYESSYSTPSKLLNPWPSVVVMNQ
jgi:murein DD-endopeptidase MepM/ murein hydrolase activator NlpD